MSVVSAPPVLAREGMPDAPDEEWFSVLLEYLNGFNDPVARALRNGIVRADNTPYKTQPYLLPHATEVTLGNPLPNGMEIKGVAALQCEGMTMDAGRPTGQVYTLALASPVYWRPTNKGDGSVIVRADYAGNIGEQTRSFIAPASANGLATNVAEDLTSITLGAGTWDITMDGGFTVSSAASDVRIGVNTTSATLPSAQTQPEQYRDVIGPVSSSQDVQISIVNYRVTPTVSTTYYGVVRATFAAGTCSAYGRLSAVRFGIDPATTGRVTLFFYGE